VFGLVQPITDFQLKVLNTTQVRRSRGARRRTARTVIRMSYHLTAVACDHRDLEVATSTHGK